MQKNILIVSVFFPPARQIAVSRIEAYAKYLSISNNVTVITLGEKEETVEYNFDNGANCKVHYLPNKGLLTAFLFYSGKESWFQHKVKTMVRVVHNKLNISHFKSWARLASKRLVEELENKNYDVLISSYAPEDVLEISYQAIKSNLNTKTKWVLDMRDEYSDELGLPIWVKKQRRANEVKYSKRADLVLSVSEPLVELFKKRMPNAKEFMELRNGFDHKIKPISYKKEAKLKIGYFGSLHGDAKPYVLFLAVKELNLVDSIEICFAVRNKTFEVPSELKDTVIFLPFMCYHGAIEKMSHMDANLLILPSKLRLGVFSGKIFDYLSAGRSILALVNPSDVAAKLIEETNSGYIADFDDLESVKEALQQLYNDWDANKLKQPIVNDIAKQHRQYQVAKLDTWINQK